MPFTFKASEKALEIVKLENIKNSTAKIIFRSEEIIETKKYRVCNQNNRETRFIFRTTRSICYN